MATSSSVICGVCDAQHITKCADYWCPECEEGLCSECHKHHSVSKSSRTHGSIPVDEYDKLPSSISKIIQHCKDHGNKYTNYCSHHDTLCCPVCISTTHRECKGFLSVKEIIKTAKTSSLLDTMQQSLNDIERNIEKVIQNRENNLSNIRQQRQKIKIDLRKIRDQINSKLDTLEQNVVTELNAAENKIQTQVKSLINRLSEERKSVHTLKKNIKTLKDHASDLQTFLGSKTYQPEVEKAEKYMKSLSEDGSLDELNLKCNIGDKILEAILTSSREPISIENGPPPLVLTTEKEKQAQIMTGISQPLPKSIDDIKLSLRHKYNLPQPGRYGYRGCIIHRNAKLILADSSRCKLIVLNSNGKHEKDIYCFSYVNDITTIDDRMVAVSTDTGIRSINIDTKKTEKVIETSACCIGITHYKGTLLWCELKKGIQRMDLSDGRISSLVKQDQLPVDSYVTTHDDKIYQTNCKTKTVMCYTIKGERLWEYKNGWVINSPVGIAADRNGNIYVTSFDSKEVAVITADGKDGKLLLSQQKGLQCPFGIYYDRTNDDVLVVNLDDTAFLYHISDDEFSIKKVLESFHD